MTLFSGLGVGSVMAAPSRLTWLRLATSKSARFGAASPTYLCERFCTSSGLGRACVAVARLGEEVRRRSGTCVSWPRPDEARAARDRAAQARAHQTEGRARHLKKRSWIVFLLWGIETGLRYVLLAPRGAAVGFLVA